MKFYVLAVELLVPDPFQRCGHPREWIVFVFWWSSSAHDLFQRRGHPRKWVVLMYQPIASVYFQSVAASNFLFICFISSFIYIYLYQPVRTKHIQVSAFYTNRSRLILLRQISNDNFLKAPLKSNNFQK